MSARILTVTLNPAIDKTIIVDRFQPGQELNVRQILLSAGGKGLNVSRVLQRLGVQNIATGLLGGISGQLITQKLQTEKILAHFVEIAGETRTSLTIRDSKSDRMTRFLEEGPTISAKEAAEFNRRYITLLKKVDFVILSGRSAVGLKDSYYYDLIQIAQRAGKKVVLDTSGLPLTIGLRAKPFLIKPNLEEAKFIFNHPLKSLSAVKKSVIALSDRGITNAVISMGHKGVVAVDGDQRVWVRPLSTWTFRNSVGCGDSFVAGFMAAVIHNKNFVERVRWGVAAAVSSAMQLQPGAIDARQVKKFIARVIVQHF